MDLEKVILKVVVLGEYGVGKSSVIKQFVNQTFTSQYNYTFVDFCTKKVVIEDAHVYLYIWDVSARSLEASIFRGSDCCILVYDVTDPQTLEGLESLIERFIEKRNLLEIAGFPFALIGNKVDLENREVEAERAREWCQSKNNMPYFETSAKTGLNIEQAFYTVAKKALEWELISSCSTVPEQPDAARDDKSKCVYL